MADCSLKVDTRRPLQDGRYPVKIAVGHGTNIYLSTGVSVDPEKEWEDGKVVGRKDAKGLNASLEIQLLRVRSRLLRLRESGRLAGIGNSYLRKLLEAPDMDEVPEEDSRLTFWEIADRCIATKEGNTKVSYEYTLKKVRAFAGDAPLYINDIDRVWLHGFEASIGGKVNSRAIHLRNLRHICNFALDEEYTDRYPFRKFKIRTEETMKKALTLDQLRRLLTMEVEPWQEEYRDMFWLMFLLRGINAVDLFGATPDQVVDGRLEYRRSKVGTLFSVKLEPEALEILERYKGERHLLSPMDRYENHKDYLHRMDYGLKAIGRPLGKRGKVLGDGLFPKLSSNWARHTWATLCAEIDIPDPTITLGMGHKTAGHKTTAIYIKRDMAKVDEANRKVIDYVNGRPASHDAGRPT